MSGANSPLSVQGLNSRDLKNVQKKGRPAKSSICKECQEQFPNALIKGLHTINDCARNRQKKKCDLETQPSDDVQKFANTGHVSEIQSQLKASRVAVVLDEPRQTRNNKRSKPVKKVPNVRSRKKTRTKKRWTDSDNDEFVNEEKTSDLDSPVEKKKCLTRSGELGMLNKKATTKSEELEMVNKNAMTKSEELEMVNKNATTKLTQLAKVNSEKEISVQEAEISGEDSSSVIETLGELVAEANNNSMKNEDGEDFHLDFKLRSVDIFPLEVSITEPCIKQVPVVVEDNILIENETVVLGQIEEKMATNEEESNNQGNDTVNKDKQNKRKRKKERRKQWEVRRELRITGDSKATIEKEISKRISQGRNSSKVNKISSHDLNFKIEKIDEDDNRKSTLKARSSKSILHHPKSKITSNDSQAEKDHHDSEKAVVKSTVDNLGEASKKSFGLTLAETSSQIRPPGITKTSTARSLSSRPYNTLQLASSLYQTIPLAASSSETIPLAASPRKTIPLAEQLKLTDESDTNEIEAAEKKLKSWVTRDYANHYAGENINTKGMSTIGVTQSYGGGGGNNEDKIVANNNTFTEISDKNSVKYEITEKRLDIEQKGSVLFGSPKKFTQTMNTSKDSIDDPVMNCEDSDELNISYDGLKFSDEEEAQDGEVSDDQVEEGCQPLASSDKTKHSSSLPRPPVTYTSRHSAHLDPALQIEKKDLNENRKTLANENLGGKSNDEANVFIPIKVKEEKVVTKKPDDLEEEDDEIELDVSYTMFDEEEESSGHEKDNKVHSRNENDSSKVKSEKSKEVIKARNRIEVKEKEKRVSALDYVVPQERNDDDTEEKKETARRKTVEERKRNFEQEQLQRRGNYCLSLVKCVPCVTEGCSWVHVLDPQAALDHFYSLYHNTDQEDPSRRLLFFWKFHAMKSVPAGRAVLSAISDLASKGKLKIDTKGFSQLVDFLQSFPDFYTMSLEPGRLVMENLLEAFMSALEEEEHRARKAEIENFFAFAWNRIYLSSLRHGLVLKQKTLESICSLAENVHWYCQMVELMFLSSLCPTTWVSVEKTSSLLSRISASTDNALSCECRGLEHSREACLHLAKTLSRLMVSEWGTVARGTQNFDRKLQILINTVGGDSPQNIARFIERITQIYQGQVFLLPQLGIKSQRLKERLDRQVSAGKWRDVARDLVMIEKVRVEDMVELVEELYGLMTHLAPHVTAAGLDNLLKELEVLHCSQIHRQLYCQLGISLLINMIAMDKFPEGARVVQAIGRTGVDVRTLKPFTVFELANLDENFTPIAVPLMMLDVYICSGYIELAVNLVAHWEYLETYPRPLQSGDQQRKFDIFERILDKSLARNGENSLPMRLRIYKILCSGDVSQMPLVRRNKMKQNGKNILVEMLNKNTKGGDLWTVVEELDRALYVVTGEVARGVLLRLVQAGMKEEATSLYRRTELTVTGTYEKQDTRAEELKLLLKSYYSFEELQIIIAEFFHKLKKTLFIGEKNVSIFITEADIPQSGIFLLKRVVTSKKEALNRVRQILAYMKLQMLVSFDDIPFIPKEQVYKYIEESV